MQKNLSVNIVLLLSAVALLIFYVLLNTFTPSNLIILLNGLLAGSMVSILIAYHELIWAAIVGNGAYNRIRQMTIGFFLCWLAISITLATSIYIRYSNAPSPAFVSIAFARYLAIIAAILQVTAPDFGLGFFHGRDRKILPVSVGIGFISAIIVMVLQGA